MMILPFTIDDSRYCINIDNVVEVIPFVKITPIPKSSEHLKGLINFRGSLIPVFDLAYYLKQHYTNIYLSTRIIVVRDTEIPEIEFGIISEEVSETFSLDSNYQEEKINSYTAHPFIDEVFLIDFEMVHLVNLKKLITTIENYL
ncbi:MAG: chemotaxis protein CheW [Candidatus Kapabacteria bacterium]|nr:chemotaxis protein CheW [Candidatus Kapabacteria bacterium]